MRQKITAIIFTLFISSFTVFAQNVPPPPPPLTYEDKEEIKIESRLVMIPVSVTDASGQAVTGLTANDFRVLEENKKQEIAEVGNAEKVPLDIAILFDISATTNAMFEFEQLTAIKFLQNMMKPEDRATIFTIGESPVLVKGRDTAQNAGISIKNIVPTKQFTAFYDTVRIAAEYLNKNTPEGRRKVIVTISDGEDTNSVAIAKAIQNGYQSLGKKFDTLDNKSLYEFTVKSRDQANTKERSNVLKSLQNADTVFYSINPAGSSYKLNKISQIGQANMEKFAVETGGTAFLPKFLPIDLKSEYENSANLRKNSEALEGIFKQLANELQAQYLVQYYSDSEFPNGKYVKINIGVTNKPNIKVRAREGYFVKN